MDIIALLPNEWMRVVSRYCLFFYLLGGMMTVSSEIAMFIADQFYGGDPSAFSIAIVIIYIYAYWVSLTGVNNVQKIHVTLFTFRIILISQMFIVCLFLIVQIKRDFHISEFRTENLPLTMSNMLFSFVIHYGMPIL
jgi:hypothetical protein